MRIAYYPRDCTNSITMLLKELQGCKVNSAIILLVGARFARPKIVYVAYYSQDRDRWFGQASPTTVKLRKNIYRKAYPNASPSSSNEYLPDCNSSSLAYLEGSPLSFLYKIINLYPLPHAYYIFLPEYHILVYLMTTRTKNYNNRTYKYQKRIDAKTMFYKTRREN